MTKGTKQSKLKNILEDLDNIGDIKGSIVISVDGLVISSNIKEGIDTDTLAAMSAAMQGAAETAVSELKQGGLKQVVIESEKGKMVSISAGEDAILIILANKTINLGLALLELSKAAGSISKIIGE
ncbi:hypothetical protein GF336_04650 [Candidatus Woesearchaeota archaeon]|nr:hypothetical protein [Candidatus Woesearchaeota archaeon]